MKIPISEYIQLCRAGYTAEEIDGYCNSLAENTEQADPIQTEPAVIVQEPPAPVAENPAPAPAEPQENETQTMLRELLGIVRAGNINNLSVPTQSQVDPCAVMGSILSPVKSNK